MIELLIVMVVIGALASIAIPKFAGLMRKAQEGSAKGTLSTMRSALSIYYGDMEGQYPGDLNSLTIAGKYLNAMPQIRVPNYHAASATVYDNVDYGFGLAATDSGSLHYWNDPSAGGGRSQGDVWVGCTHTDSRGSVWTTY